MEKVAGTKIKLSSLLNIVLLIALVSVIFFGWLYYRQLSVVDVVKQAAPVRDDGPPKPEFLYSIYGPSDDRLLRPTSVIVDGNRIYVADTGRARIITFDYNGKYLTQFGKPGKEKGAVINPTGLALVNNQIYVADPGTGKISIYTKEGNFVGYFGEKIFKKPGYLVYKDNKFYVLDVLQQKVTVLDSTGNILVSFGEYGYNQGQFRFAHGLNVDDEGKIYVADSNNYRIQVFNPDGKSHAVWQGKKKDLTDGYIIPRGISFDKRDFVYSANAIAGAVSISQPTGKRLALFNEGDSPDDDMTLPVYTFIDGNNRLYVAEHGSDRILVYRIP